MPRIEAPVFTLTGLLAIALTIIGLMLLRASWLSDRKPHMLFAGSGWLAVGAGLALLTRAMGTEVGIAYGLVLLSLIAYAVVAGTTEFRAGSVRASASLALEPEACRTNWPRAIAKSLLAIVLAGTAAIGIGVAFAVATPFGVHDRIVIGGLLVPVLWGAGMAWTLADAKLLRATAILLAISAVSYGIAFLPKVLMR